MLSPGSRGSRNPSLRLLLLESSTESKGNLPAACDWSQCLDLGLLVVLGMAQGRTLGCEVLGRAAHAFTAGLVEVLKASENRGDFTFQVIPHLLPLIGVRVRSGIHLGLPRKTPWPGRRHFSGKMK